MDYLTKQLKDSNANGVPAIFKITSDSKLHDISEFNEAGEVLIPPGKAISIVKVERLYKPLEIPKEYRGTIKEAIKALKDTYTVPEILTLGRNPISVEEAIKNEWIKYNKGKLVTAKIKEGEDVQSR